MKKDLGRAVKLFMAATLCGGVLAGCGNSENFVFTNTNIAVPVQPVLQAPVAVNDTVSALGNSTLLQQTANSVLNNDTLNGGEIVSFDATSANGATVVLNADGSFQYTPTVGFTGPDTFTYTLGNADGESTATVTVNVNGLGFFVNNSLGSNGTGTQASPFNNLADAVAAAGNGDTIFVYAGDGGATNQTGTFLLPQGVNLIGQAQGLVVAQTIEPAGNRPVIAGTVQPGGNNTISGFEFIDSVGGSAIEATDIDNIIIQNNVFTGLLDDNIALDNVGGTYTVTGNEFDGPQVGDCLEITNTDTNGTFTFSNNMLTDDNTGAPQTGVAFNAAGNSVVTCNITDNAVTGVGSTFFVPFFISTSGTVDTTAVITGNNITDASTSAAVYIDSGATMGVDATISNNVIEGSDDDGIDYEWGDNVADTFVVTIENNNITDVGSKPYDIDGFTSASSTGIFFVRNNTGDSNSSVSLQFDLAGMANACLDLFGNTFAENVNLSNFGGTFDVERADPGDGGPLDAVGVNSIGGTLNTSGLTSQEAGFCQSQIP